MVGRILDLKTVSADGKWVVSTVALAGTRGVFRSMFNPDYLSDSYETMVFAADATGKVADFADHYRAGYGEILEAKIGHELAVTALNAGKLELS